jgi:glutamyl-tRNA synthetase
MKERSKTLIELLEMGRFVLGARPFEPDDKAAKHLDSVSRGMLERLTSHLRNASWTAPDLEAEVRRFAEGEGLSLGKVAQPVRVALTGRTISPSVFDMMEILGPDESLARLEDCLGRGHRLTVRTPARAIAATSAGRPPAPRISPPRPAALERGDP